jgi:hypothetical protein
MARLLHIPLRTREQRGGQPLPTGIADSAQGAVVRQTSSQDQERCGFQGISRYEALLTLTTGEYGDMKARTNAQMLYTIVALGFALGLLGRLILQMTRLQAACQQRPYDG